ncbi:choline O-acetyltransferase isoform X1 [Folsomia candida]|nr:choline O-acetyltransferase isoform X1 [Folsomia candida]
MQPDLPKLPVPDLDKTLQRYLEAIQPILTPVQYERAEKLTHELAENEGPELQNELTERQMKMQNWAYEWWLNDMYMNNPLSLPINSNPGGVWPPQHFPSVDDQLLFAAKLVTYMLDFKDILDRRELPVEKAASREPGQPLCMAQHYRLFTSYRVPSIPRDFRRDTSQLSPDHIIVAYKKHFFTCPIKTAERRLTTPEIYGQLKKIVLSETCNNETPIGILTSQKRPVWADERIKLLGDDVNKQSIEEIETCYFIVCLDDPLPGQHFNSPYNQKKRNVGRHWTNDRDETNMMHQMLHGGGSSFNTGNRWFDKTLQFVISSDGVVGLCYEHSSAEGIGVLNLVDEFYGNIGTSEKHNANGDVVDSENKPIDIPAPIKLEWTTPPDTKSAVREACTEIDGLIDSLDLMVYRFENYGKDFIKKCKVSPDVYLQLALQLAYFNLHGKMVATYESGSTRRYKLGRVDCIRSTTMEALDWVKSMQPGCTDDSMEKMRKFHHAVEKQTTVMVENILGEGIDVHLMGLRQQSIDMGKDIPKLFDDETFQIANHFSLSTSQLPTKQDQFMGYGAVVQDGYGASYNPQNSSIIFCLASFRTCSYTSTLKFGQSLQQSLELMKKVLE